MVAASIEMLLQQAAYTGRIQVAALHSALIEQRAQNQFLQFHSHPVNQRQCETLLFAIQYLAGYSDPLRELAEDVFLALLSHLPSRWQCYHPLHKFMIQEGTPRFQRSEHAHPVYLGQNVARKVGLGVKIQHSTDRVRRHRSLQATPQWR